MGLRYLTRSADVDLAVQDIDRTEHGGMMVLAQVSAEPGDKMFEIVGAGPAGLVCAIVLAKTSRRVVVREWHQDVGHRFHDDFQGVSDT